MIEIQSVTIEHHRETLGIGEASPRVSWKFKGEDTDWTQTAYEIQILRFSKDRDLERDGKYHESLRLTDGETISNSDFEVSPGVDEPSHFYFASSESVLVPWPTTPLLSRERARVRIRASGSAFDADKIEFTAWSESVDIEAGLLSRDDWTATLIGAPKTRAPNGSLRPALFRKLFKLKDGGIRSARLYITSQGVYEANINGKRVGDHVFSPGWTSYRHHLNYQTFDVKDLLLQNRENILGVEVGEGWFATRLGFSGGRRNIYGDQLAILAQLEIVFENGQSFTVNSDGTWCTEVSPIISSEIYDGEIYDAGEALKYGGWHAHYSLVESRWFSDLVVPLDFPNSQLMSSKGPPVKLVEAIKPKQISKSPTGKIIVDFGQNLVGWLSIRVHGSKGHEITFTHTEVLEHGECATRPLRDCKAIDTLILSDEAIRWEPKFTFHGFRYVQVDGWPSSSGEPSLQDITAVVHHTDMEQTGFFECSEPIVNQLHQNIRWGMKGNFLSIPTDCPQRDERLGWTGDIQIFSPTANFLYNTAGMLSGWLQDLAAEQLIDYDGIPPLVCPNVIDPIVSPTEAMAKPQAAWSDAVIVTPLDLYNAFGDRKILQNQHLSMKTWLDTALPRGPNNLWDPTVQQLGDWLDPAAPPEEPGNGRTDPHLVANAYLVRITEFLAVVSKVLDLTDDYYHYTSQAASIKNAFQYEYLTPSGRLAPDTMTSLSLGLTFNLFRNATETTTAASRLATIVQASKFRIATGFVGTPLILPALTTAGFTQFAYRMLLENECPSWLYPITMGATTMWERWDSMLPDGSINPGEMTSFNHYALGSVGAWLHGNVGGISALEPGWKKVLFKPVPGGTVRWAKVRFESPYGTVSCEWKIEAGSFGITAMVPPNTTGRIVLPGDAAGVEVGSGVYEFKVAYEEPEWPPTAD